MAALEELQNQPQLKDFRSLQEYEAQTPGTFFNGKPVLHFYARKTYISLPLVAQQKHRALEGLTHNEEPADQEGNIRVDDIDVWVTDQRLILYSQATSKGCRIPYPAIGITAIDKPAVLLEMNLSDPNNTADDDIEYFQLKIFTTNVEDSTHREQSAAAASGTNGTTPSEEAITAALYKAITDCQELNPDPPGPGEEDEDGEPVFDETAPGATGWITSENMDQYVDADGNFKMPEGVTFIGGEDDEAVNSATENGVEEPLGEGAGRTRTATEAGVEREDESKWRATGS